MAWLKILVLVTTITDEDGTWTIASFGQRKRPQVSLKISNSNCGRQFCSLLGICRLTTPPSPAHPDGKVGIIGLMPQLIHRSTLDASVVCRNIHCWHYIQAARLKPGISWTINQIKILTNKASVEALMPLPLLVDQALLKVILLNPKHQNHSVNKSN